MDQPLGKRNGDFALGKNMMQLSQPDLITGEATRQPDPKVALYRTAKGRKKQRVAGTDSAADEFYGSTGGASSAISRSAESQPAMVERLQSTIQEMIAEMADQKACYTEVQSQAQRAEAARLQAQQVSRGSRYGPSGTAVLLHLLLPNRLLHLLLLPDSAPTLLPVLALFRFLGLSSFYL